MVMKIIKIGSKSGLELFSSIRSEKLKMVLLPEDSEALNVYNYSETEDNSLYLIESMPDKANPLNYNGVSIALKIYFSHLKGDKLKFKIIIWGFEDKTTFFEDCDYSMFLKCPGIEYLQVLSTPDNISYSLGLIDKNDALENLKNIGIKPPTSYKSHHSITNEWAISRWSEYLGNETPLFTEIESSLYFQYLKTIHGLEPIQKNETYLVSNNKRLLLIDDEEGKGWKLFFDKLKLPGSNLKIESIGSDFKHYSTKDEIVRKATDKIKQFNPDTIILDLRLHDADFEENRPKQLTGFMILEKIKKEINKGIQVIIFTASNKIWNYQTLQEVGFDGFIIKESPELSVDESFTAEAISDLKNQLDICFKRSYLKVIYNDTININDSLNKLNYCRDFIETIKNQISMAYYLLSKAKENEEFAYAFVTLYMVLETINKKLVVQNEEDRFWYINGEKLKNWFYDSGKYIENKNHHVKERNPPEWQKLAGLYFQSWKGQNHEFVNETYHLIKYRNGFLHNDKKIKESNIKFQDIYNQKGFINLFEKIKEILGYL